MPGGGKNDDEREWTPLQYRVMEKAGGNGSSIKFCKKAESFSEKIPG